LFSVIVLQGSESGHRIDWVTTWFSIGSAEVLYQHNVAPLLFAQ